MPEDKAKLKPTNFTIKKPCEKEKRRTFQILPYARAEFGKKIYGPPIENEALKALNQRYLAKEIDIFAATNQIKNIIVPNLRNKSKIPDKLASEASISEENMKVFRDFWNKAYRRKKMEAPETAKSQFMKALRSLEPLSLITADIDDIQDLWDDEYKGQAHKRYGGRINQLLDHLNRDVKLSLDKVAKVPPRYVTLEELHQILAYVENPILKDLYLSLWGTGCRLGEIFALNSSELGEDDSIYICKQMTIKGKLKLQTKNRVEHNTIVLPEPEVKEALIRWLAVPNKIEYRKCCSHPLILASRKTFQSNPKKWISPHKLRHSFVRYLIQRRLSLNDIKDLIGDTLKTTEETYGGWVKTKVEIQQIHSHLAAAKKLADEDQE